MTLFVVVVVGVAVVVVWFQSVMRKALKARAETLPVGTVQTFTYTGKSGWLSEQFSKMLMEQHINLMITNGWEVVAQTGIGGHVRLGRTLAGAALTGGLSLLAGGSRTADRATITYRRVRAPKRNATTLMNVAPLAAPASLSKSAPVSASFPLQQMPSDLLTALPPPSLCPYCGKYYAGKARFCPFCGKPQEVATVPV
jgi:hypothetical protein